MDPKKTYKWIKNGYMKKGTEGLITGAQDQALPTRWRKSNIEKQTETSICRIHNQGEYKNCHDKVAHMLKPLQTI